MKKSRLFSATLAAVLFLAGPIALSWSGEPGAPAVKLLTVGNSFADNATVYLPELAKAGGKKLVIFRANLPGHSLEQHASYIKAYEADHAAPKGSPYTAPPSLAAEGKKVSLSEILASDQWTVITIQQYSALSFKEETYEPFAGILVDYLRKHAPQAEILVHETWAYRQDSKLFTKDFTQQDMYDKLKAAYGKLAEHYGLRTLPSGDAFQAARQTPRWTFKFPDPNFDYANPPAKALPEQSGSLNRGWYWGAPAENPKLTLDANHANLFGQYLAAAVWYEVIFKDSVENNPFVPKDISPEDAAQLRHIAHTVVAARASH